MKTTLKFLSWMFILLFTVSLSSCKDDDDESVELADVVSGVYVGKLQSGGLDLDDAYRVEIVRVSSTAVELVADFIGSGAIFNVEQAGSQYILRNTSSFADISIFVSNNTLNISYSNKMGTMTTFVGTK